MLYSDNFGDSDNIVHELDKVLELLTVTNTLTMDMMPEIDQFYITFQFELAKAMSHGIKTITYIRESTTLS